MLLDAAHQPEIEVGIVDEDQRVRLLRRAAASTSCCSVANERGITLQRLGQAGDRQAVEVGDQPAAGGGEPLAAEAEHVDVGLAAAQRFDQRARVQIAGGLAARQQDARHSGRAGSRRAS